MASLPCIRPVRRVDTVAFCRQCPVDGHLAPVDELLMRARRSVNTQTPLDDQLLSPTLSADMESLGLTGEPAGDGRPSGLSTVLELRVA